VSRTQFVKYIPHRWPHYLLYLRDGDRERLYSVESLSLNFRINSLGLFREVNFKKQTWYEEGHIILWSDLSRRMTILFPLYSQFFSASWHLDRLWVLTWTYTRWMGRALS